MYPLRLVDLTELDEAFAASGGRAGPHDFEDRTSDVRLRAPADEEDDSGLRLAREFAGDALDDTSERTTIPPPRTTSRPRRVESLDEVLFRFSCGDFAGALAAAEALMTRVPVVIMPRDELRAEPLGYWALLLLGRVDGSAPLSELLADVPPAEAVRVICDLVERRIIALR
jgi:hypothetical protein